MRRLALLSCLLATPLAAQEVNCANQQTQMELNICAERDWQAADKDLNAAYKAAMAVMKQIDADQEPEDRGAADNLPTAQRAWITFRDANCAAEGYLMHGGSAEPLLIYSCYANLTRVRAADLWTLSQSY